MMLAASGLSTALSAVGVITGIIGAAALVWMFWRAGALKAAKDTIDILRVQNETQERELGLLRAQVEALETRLMALTDMVTQRAEVDKLHATIAAAVETGNHDRDKVMMLLGRIDAATTSLNLAHTSAAESALQERDKIIRTLDRIDADTSALAKDAGRFDRAERDSILASLERIEQAKTR